VPFKLLLDSFLFLPLGRIQIFSLPEPMAASVWKRFFPVGVVWPTVPHLFSTKILRHSPLIQMKRMIFSFLISLLGSFVVRVFVYF